MGNFYTDVIKPSKWYSSSERCADPMMLEPVTRRKAQAIIVDAKAHGVLLAIYETYRSVQQQSVQSLAPVVPPAPPESPA